jgi:hypothetical protein
MLRAGVRAAGDVDVDRRVEREPCRLVSASANLQPTLPVQATRPPRMLLAEVPSPSASISAVTAATSAFGMSEISRFCHTVNRSVPEP